MADSSASSLTSTSHTLTANGGGSNSVSLMMTATAAAAAAAAGFPMLSDMSGSDSSAALAFREAIQKPQRQVFLTPSAVLPKATTQFAQAALCSFAGQVGDEQQEQLRQLHAATVAARKAKRKREANSPPPPASAAAAAAAASLGPILKNRRVHIDGFEVPQIWQQSNRIVLATLAQAKLELQRLDESDEIDGDATADGVTGSDDDEEEDDDILGSDVDFEALADMLDGELDGGMDEEDNDEDDEDDEEEEEEESDEEEPDVEDEADEDDELNQPNEEFAPDSNGLNDGFFDIDKFNKQSQWFEDQDARADPNTDRVSDDEEEAVDWHTDPLSTVPRSRTKQKRKASAAKTTNGRRQRGVEDDADAEDDELVEDEEGDEEEDDDNEAPAFGDMDLDAPSGESDAELDDGLDGEGGGLASGLDMDLTANDIYYKDFFAPPPRKRQEDDGRHFQHHPSRGAPGSGGAFQPDEADVQRAMDDVRRDLFEQISEASGSDLDGDGEGSEADSQLSAGDPRARRSAHQRRQAKILAEIRRLEAEAIKEKSWAMSGEASAGARPINSLIEDPSAADLEFEHIGKPVPVITQEISEDIEQLVKRRILDQEFDEVRRRYATDSDAGERRRGLVEIDDRQAQKGLAAVYEEEHQQQANPDAYVSASDERLRADEQEVERLWLDVSAQLDALSSWHYKPRPAAPALTVVADVATVAMEDAQPATAQGIAGSQSMLAPQEVYRPGAKGDLGRGGGNGSGSKGDGDGDGDGDDGDNVVVVAKTGLPVARDEMTREEKRRRRRRNKERIRKSGSGLPANQPGSKANANGQKTETGSRQDTMAALRKAGVKVINRKGEVQDLDGNAATATRALSSGNYKL